MTVTVTTQQLNTKSVMDQLSKMTYSTPVTIRVVADVYSRGEEMQVANVQYEGPLQEVLTTIAERHGYGVDEEERNLSCVDIYNSIVDSNGDGCDMIYSMEMINHHDFNTITRMI